MPPRRDAGQAFPIYLTVVAGLLFLALAYLAVGQAAVNRSGAQTAADAAALAAAQKTRDQLAGMWTDDIRDPAKWQAIFDGDGAVNSCWRAGQLAAANDATAQCTFEPPLSYAVEAKTNKSVGDSVVPGTENVHSTAHAIAVIKPLCTFTLSSGEDAGEDTLPPLTCEDDKVWHLEPDDTTGLPKPEDLFDVHLADSPANDR
ncbi:pilus assembly protein TadG-related protein [Streptomyces naphthomycinicus]|uniref:pilus assembly protein TadG-related protein n=1 Tax=Streptomyces naphthomycinicus TaxID=2872625 RepID=UPI003B75D0DD